jgi:hypothetical protein
VIHFIERISLKNSKDKQPNKNPFVDHQQGQKENQNMQPSQSKDAEKGNQKSQNLAHEKEDMNL